MGTFPKMNVVTLRPHDRFGNVLFQYCYARAYARKVGAQLQVEPWVGTQIFEINDPPIEKDLPQRYDMDMAQWDGETNINLTGWGLHQNCLLYSRADAKEWLKFKPWVAAALSHVPRLELAAHIRHGDFFWMADYIAISMASYFEAMEKFGFDRKRLTCLTQDTPILEEQLVQAGLGFLPDFFAMMQARVLFRANSTFSWWAATLGNNDAVFSPHLKDIKPKANEYQHVPFVEGNWPAVSYTHPNCSDLHLKDA